jgi:PilZ domain
MNDRRIENRFACADLVRVEWLEDKGEVRATEAVLEDISRVGACIEVEERIPLGAAINFTLNNTQLFGHVCYCVFRDYGYFVGVRFREDSGWSSGSAEPAHLTDLRQIAELATEV